eukprot:354232-Chlamydomonas_euryale.AAC.12
MNTQGGSLGRTRGGQRVVDGGTQMENARLSSVRAGEAPGTHDAQSRVSQSAGRGGSVVCREAPRSVRL